MNKKKILIGVIVFMVAALVATSFNNQRNNEFVFRDKEGNILELTDEQRAEFEKNKKGRQIEKKYWEKRLGPRN